MNNDDVMIMVTLSMLRDGRINVHRVDAAADVSPSAIGTLALGMLASAQYQLLDCGKVVHYVNTPID